MKDSAHIVAIWSSQIESSKHSALTRRHVENCMHDGMIDIAYFHGDAEAGPAASRLCTNDHVIELS